MAVSAAFLASFFPLFFRELGTYHDTLLCVLSLFVISLILSSLPVFIQPSRLKIPMKGWFFVVLVGVCSLVGNWAFQTSLHLLEPAISSTIQRLELVFVTILGALFFAEKINRAFVISIFCVLLGLFFLQGGEFSINDYLLWAIFVTLLSAFSFALMLAFSKVTTQYMGIVTMNFYRLLLMVLGLIVVLDFAKLQELSLYAWLLAMMSAICGPVGARFLITASLRYISMSTALLYTMVSPIFTACWQWLIWGTILTTTEMIGAVMILVGVSFVLLKKLKVNPEF